MALPTSCPFPTVDIIITLPDHPEARPDRPVIVLIERRFPPHGWAIPGGFVDPGEPLHRAAAREAEEETTLKVELLEQFFSYSDPARDPRRHTISTVFVARASGEPKAADDAGRIGCYPIDQLPPLAFDHGQILADWLHYLRTGQRPPATR